MSERTIITLDIETVPTRPEDRLFAQPDFSAELPEPTEDNVPMGNIKDPEKRAAKLSGERLKWTAAYCGAELDWADGGGKYKCALKAHLGRVAMVGIAMDDNDPFTESLHGGDERSLIALIFMHMQSAFTDTSAPVIVGHNCTRFDLPFLCRRALVNGVKVPPWLVDQLNSHRPTMVVDTMTAWAMGDRQTYISLEHLCGVLGVPLEDHGVKGETFYRSFAEDPAACEAYCRQDVWATREVARAMKLI